MKNKIWRYICLVAVLCLLGLSACNKGQEKEEDVSPSVEQDNPKETNTDVASGDTQADLNQEEDKLEDGAEQGEAPQAKVPEKTQPEATKPFWQTESTRQMNNLIAIAAAGQADYKANGAKRNWMSKNGKLYSYDGGIYITTDALVADGYLEEGLSSADYEILLIDGNDLMGYDGVSVPSDSLNFGIFAATKQSGKYLIAAPSGKVGQLSEENYRQLLAEYNQNNGSVIRLSSTSDEYSRILNYISLFEGRFDDYFVREIRKDNKYAMVVFSNRKDVTQIKQYVLKNENNFWEVVFPNLQEEYNPILGVNKYLPDFNTALLPAYNLAAWRGSIVAYQGGAVAAMFSGNYIASEDEISYQCATANCSYIILKNGQRFACYKGNGIWKAVPVESDVAAQKIFREKAGADYGFLILDD